MSILAFAVSAMAEPDSTRHFTWVDAQGVTHNTLIDADKNSSSGLKIDESEFPSEEKYQQNLDDRRDEKKPFFTWTDASGRLRSDVKPDVTVEFFAKEIVYDIVFAPPFRLPDYVKQGRCCQAYSEAFTATAAFDGSVSYQVDDTLFPFQTQSGNVAAGYFSLPELAAKEIILLKGYKLPRNSSFDVIALDHSYQPLYLGSEIEGVFVEKTWKNLAYKKIMLEVSDTDIKYLVVFVKQKDAVSSYRLSLIRDQLID
ncbi:MAG: hypothetical protein ACJASG_000978 [Oleiphilaceae bacterium]|jgi:hypothetical protein